MNTERDEEDKAMTNTDDVRRAHNLLDSLFDNSELSHAQIDLIRGLMPELPAQKTLEEITAHVYDAWLASSDYEFNGNEYDPDVTIEDWLLELHKQLKGLKDMSVAVPALPAGMRIAEHENFGRVVVSPGVGIDRCHEIFYLDPGMSSGTDISEVEPDSLTFIDAEPAYPEFLETEADYNAAPEGTIVASSGRFPWVKGAAGEWACSSSNNSNFAMSKIGRRNVLRWGWGE